MKKHVLILTFLFSLFINRIPSFAEVNHIPTITLNKSDTLLVEVGTPYEEFGATASDEEDGDLTSKIVIDSSLVDTNKEGSYEVTYTVSDKDQNVVTVNRTVHVLSHKIWQIKGEGIILETKNFDLVRYSSTITRMNQNGKVLWTYGNEIEYVNYYKVVEKDNGNFIAMTNLNIIELSADGKLINKYDYQKTFSDFIFIDMQVSNDNGFYIYGEFNGIKWDYQKDLIEVNDRLKDYQESTNLNVILKYNEQGKIEWKKIIPYTSFNGEGKIIASKDGLYLTVSSYDPLHNFPVVYLLHLSQEGEVLKKQLLSLKYGRIDDFIETQDHHFVLLSNINKSFIGAPQERWGEQFYVSEFDSDFNELWSTKIRNNYSILEEGYHMMGVVELSNHDLIILTNSWETQKSYSSMLYRLNRNGNLLDEIPLDTSYDFIEKTYDNCIIASGTNIDEGKVITKINPGIKFEGMFFDVQNKEIELNQTIDFSDIVYLSFAIGQGIDLYGHYSNEVGNYDLIAAKSILHNNKEYTILAKTRLTVNPIIENIKDGIYHTAVTPQITGGIFSFALQYTDGKEFYDQYKMGDEINLPGRYVLLVEGNNGYKEYINFYIEPVITGLKQEVDFRFHNFKTFYYRDEVTPKVSVGTIRINDEQVDNGITVTKNGYYTFEVIGIDGVQYKYTIHFVIDRPHYNYIYIGSGLVFLSSGLILYKLKREKFL